MLSSCFASGAVCQRRVSRHLVRRERGVRVRGVARQGLPRRRSQPPRAVGLLQVLQRRPQPLRGAHAAVQRALCAGEVLRARALRDGQAAAAGHGLPGGGGGS